MSILNLNTPQGGNFGGKKKAKMWMGAGLLAAVLGVGSTLAANITINSPELTTEFGQGVTQTVFCGEGETSVNVSPASSYVNPTFKVKIYTSEGSSTVTPATTKTTIYGKSSSSFPRFNTSSSNMEGWWVLASNPTGALTSQPTIATVLANPSNYIFAPKKTDSTFKAGGSTADYVVDAIDNSSSFRLSSVTISKIPSACANVNFVLSAWSDSSTALTLVANSSGSTKITEVAAKWTDSNRTVNPSQSRTGFEPTSLVTATQDDSPVKNLTFTFVPGTGGTALSSKDLLKLIVETQEDTLGSSSSS